MAIRYYTRLRNIFKYFSFKFIITFTEKLTKLTGLYVLRVFKIITTNSQPMLIVWLQDRTIDNKKQKNFAKNMLTDMV